MSVYFWIAENQLPGQNLNRVFYSVCLAVRKSAISGIIAFSAKGREFPVSRGQSMSESFEFSRKPDVHDASVFNIPKRVHMVKIMPASQNITFWFYHQYLMRQFTKSAVDVVLQYIFLYMAGPAEIRFSTHMVSMQDSGFN